MNKYDSTVDALGHATCNQGPDLTLRQIEANRAILDLAAALDRAIGPALPDHIADDGHLGSTIPTRYS